jgi:hypothetical protein
MNITKIKVRVVRRQKNLTIGMSMEMGMRKKFLDRVPLLHPPPPTKNQKFPKKLKKLEKN